jgi:hypothetical protein
MIKMKAFLGDPGIKEKFLSRVRAHREADELIKGSYWEGGKGCAIGCTIHSGKHPDYEWLLGIPQILARLEDEIFESLPNGSAMLWPERFLSAIEPGADLSLVWPRFAVWMLGDEKWGVLQFAKSARSKRSIQSVADAYRSVIDDGDTKKHDWAALRSAAAYAAAAYDDYADYADKADYAAAYGAAYAAAYAYAAYAAYAAAYAAYAADHAGAADYGAAYTKWRSAHAEKLLELLASAAMGDDR